MTQEQRTKKKTSPLEDALNGLLFCLRRKERFVEMDGAFILECHNGIAKAVKDLLREFPNSGLEVDHKRPEGQNADIITVRFQPNLDNGIEPKIQCKILAEKISHFAAHNLIGHIVHSVRETIYNARGEIESIGEHFPNLAKILRAEMVRALQKEKTSDKNAVAAVG